MKAHKVLARALADNGVTQMFGLIGDGNMYHVADYMADERTAYVGAVIEGAALSMADGYARITGQVGVVSVTHGPGAANTINAMLEAVRASSPVLLITGDVPPKRGHNQRVDLAALFAATGADYHRVLAPENMADDVTMALARVAATRRPLVLDVPIAVQLAEVDYRPSRGRVVTPNAMVPDDDSLDEALGILASARRPLILAGHGAVVSGAGQDLMDLADLLGAPLATTVSAKDLFQGHPYNLGLMGGYGFPWAIDVMTKSDCIVVFGASLSAHTTVDGELLAGRQVIQCDLEPGHVGRFFPVDVAVNGDARSTAAAMAAKLRDAEIEPTGFRRARLGDGVLGRDPHDEYVDRSSDTTLDMRTAMVVLDEILPVRRSVVTDCGRFMAVPWRYLHVDDAKHFIHTAAWASIGLGIPTAIGAACGDRDALAVAVVGDGGGMMLLSELSTAVRSGIPCVVVVLNDSAYGVEYGKFAAKGYDPATCFIEWPEFADVARAYGADAVTVRTEKELRDLESLVVDIRRPLLIDVKCDPRSITASSSGRAERPAGPFGLVRVSRGHAP